MASTYISRAATGSVTSDKTFTYSMWVKRGTLGTVQYIWMHENASSHTQKIDLHFVATDKMRMGFWNGSNEYNLDSKMLFRDTNAWYHIVFRFDTTQSTASDRIRWYVNGEQIELEAIGGGSPTPQYPAQNTTMNLGQKILAHGRYQSSSPDSYFTGSMSHIHYCDGQSYAPTEFGETDSTTGEWKIKANPSLTYGNNGYFILKDGNSVTNQAGNSSGNFSVSGGTLTKTEDCPSNVFATMNPLDANASMLFSNGNTTTVSPSNNYMPCKATIGMLGQNGKFYWEGKCLSGSAHYFGVYDASGTVRGSVQSDMDSNRFVYTYQGGMERTITGQSAINSGTYATIANNDIIGVGLDKENGTITFWKNGTQIYTETHSSLQTKDLIAGTQAYGSDINWNFGNGYFGTTAVSSAGTNASGNGIFEYDTPTGYTALSTKGLNL